MTSVNKETKENKESKEIKENKEKVYPKLSEIPQMLCEIYLAETQKKRENSTWYDNYYDDIKAVINHCWSPRRRGGGSSQSQSA